MKITRIPVVILGLIIMLVLGINFTGSCNKEVSTVGMDLSKPPLDTNRPSITQTATFALG